MTDTKDSEDYEGIKTVNSEITNKEVKERKYTDHTNVSILKNGTLSCFSKLNKVYFIIS